MKHNDSGVRYWAIVGCFQLQKKVTLDLDLIRSLLKDDSHEVQAMAAWILHDSGDKSTAQAHFITMLENNSYAALKVCNILAWIGDDITPYKEALSACNEPPTGYVGRMRINLGGTKSKKEETK